MTTCRHKRTQFKKTPQANYAIRYCLDCQWRETISMQAAFERIIQMLEEK